LNKITQICLSKDISSYSKERLERLNLSECILLQKDLSLRTVNMIPLSTSLYLNHIYINDIEGIVHKLDCDDLSFTTLGY